MLKNARINAWQYTVYAYIMQSQTCRDSKISEIQPDISKSIHLLGVGDPEFSYGVEFITIGWQDIAVIYSIIHNHFK